MEGSSRVSFGCSQETDTEQVLASVSGHQEDSDEEPAEAGGTRWERYLKTAVRYALIDGECTKRVVAQYVSQTVDFRFQPRLEY